MPRRHHQRACHKHSRNIPASLPPIRLPDQPLPAAPCAPSLTFDRDGAPSSVATGNIPFGPAGQEDSLGITSRRENRIHPGPASTHVNSATSCRPNRAAAIPADSPKVRRSTDPARPSSEATLLGAESARGPQTGGVRTDWQFYRNRIPTDSTTGPAFDLMHLESPSHMKASTPEPPTSSRQAHIATGVFNVASSLQSPAQATREGISIPEIQAHKSQHRRRYQSRDPTRRIIPPRPLRCFKKARKAMSLPHHRGPEPSFSN